MFVLRSSYLYACIAKICLPRFTNARVEIYYFFKIPIIKQITPAPTQRNFDGDSLSDIPTSPTVVVAIRMSGPTKASDEFTTNALSIWFNRSMSSAAQISIVPDVSRSDAIVNTILLSMNGVPPFNKPFIS
jgi:hypothetical protein